jgi:class 3 adenylate cyclase
MEFLENAIPGVFIISTISLGDSFEDLKVGYVNPSFANLFGVPDEAFVNNAILPERYWVRPEERESYLAALRRDGAVQGIEVELKRPDQSRFWVRLFSKVLKFHDAAFQVQGTLIDISLQKQLERDLQVYQKNLERLVKERTKKLEIAKRELEARNQELEDLLKRVTFLEAIHNQMTKFVPRVVKEIIEKNPEVDPGKQDKDVSILFLDVKGCTHLCEKLGRADMNYVLERYFSAFLDRINHHMGDVNETMGDGLMVIYQTEDKKRNALNAARSAVAILTDTHRLNKELREAFPPVTINIGISSGVAAVGVTKFTSPAGDRWTYTATGPVTNLSSRLCSAATDGTILIDEETATRVNGLLRLREVGTRNFKNVGSPVKVFAVVEALSLTENR